ncbi:fibrillin-like protein, related [Neospora caninum Liverpool]|uniref:Fibrillin-like protein, related n=1 Tax=Neospora caninum (strain Liverpool) TaxID=572307 RepID=F0V9S8_NEOCL|nr:fibrillin-like protein, related [Neospora caninum Liverpool]CBZ50239.1 fibrillin-like protein, related [Neospora caninum Liverpool]CEL64840.1 TPA: Fibrillin-like protein, related [Neospora caninum Liverpool]|eukprot:XP_003880274.1 fibrillin-like protein, related [Neospora caninum Liverpool]
MRHANAHHRRLTRASPPCHTSSLFRSFGGDQPAATTSGCVDACVCTPQRPEGKRSSVAGVQRCTSCALRWRSPRQAVASIVVVLAALSATFPSYTGDLAETQPAALGATAFKVHSPETESALIQAHSQLTQAEPTLPAGSEWICREAYNGEGCGTGTNTQLGAKEAYCQEEDCCLISTGKCTRTPGLCATDSFLQLQYSWGKCNSTQCARCGPNATCGYIASTTTVRGGVYCTCKSPFVGTGASCVVEACKGRNPCGQGVCIPTTDAQKNFECECNPGYTEVPAGTAYSTCMDICKQKGCGDSAGVEACIGGVDAHMCVCKEGYRLTEDASRQQCVKNDPCTINPCGSSAAVAKCETEENGLEYKCTCAAGHVVRYVNGTQVCLEEGKPCSSPTCSVDPPAVSTTSTTTSTSSTSKTGDKSESEGTSGGAIAGGVIGGVAFLGLCGAGAYFFKRKSESGA